MLHFLLDAQAVGDALVRGQCTLDGQASCGDCKDDSACDHDQCIKDLALAGSADAQAIADLKLTFNPGFCEGGGFGGELLDSYFAAVRVINLRPFSRCSKIGQHSGRNPGSNSKQQM